jgi:hypothetical protein
MIPASGNERVPLESGGKVTGFCKKKFRSTMEMEAVFQPEYFWIFSVTFRAFPAEIHTQMVIIQQKMVRIS